MSPPPPLRSPPPGPPRFDAPLGVWIVERHADVTAALADARLVIPGSPHPVLPAGAGPGSAVRTPGAGAVRAAAGRALAPERLSALRRALTGSARARADGLPAGERVDLVDAFALPWSQDVAMRVTGARAADGPRLIEEARTIFLAAARATGPGATPRAAEATSELARILAASAGGGRPADPQAFVALAWTLPYLLGAAWEVLLQNPEAVTTLRRDPDRMGRAVEELLRLASPARAVFREAATPIEWGDSRIGAGEPVVLLLARANRDPARFPDPDRLDLDRFHRARSNLDRVDLDPTDLEPVDLDPADGAVDEPPAPRRGHVALGQGLHGCPGAPLVRLCLGTATRALLDRWAAIEPAGPGDRLGGFAIDAPTSVPVRLGSGPSEEGAAPPAVRRRRSS